jgi:hypothetical protein
MADERSGRPAKNLYRLQHRSRAVEQTAVASPAAAEKDVMMTAHMSAPNPMIGAPVHSTDGVLYRHYGFSTASPAHSVNRSPTPTAARR